MMTTNTTSKETQMDRMESQETLTLIKLFEPGEWSVSKSAQRYDQLENASFMHMHVHGNHGCVSAVVERANDMALLLKEGIVTSVYPTIYGDDAMVLRTYLHPEGDDIYSVMYFTTDHGERHHDWLHSRVVDFNRFHFSA